MVVHGNKQQFWLLRIFEILGKRHKVATLEEEGQNHALRHIASIVIARWRV